MVRERYLGLNFAPIAKEDIPYTGEKLEKNDMIENPNGIQLLYMNSYYILITNNHSDFLPNSEVFTHWKKIIT